MKLNKIEKDLLKCMKAGWVADVDAKVITVAPVVTIAWTRPFNGSKMISVATSYFDRTETDKFRRKTGEFHALIRLTAQYPQFIQLPLGELPDSVIESVLTDMFVL